MSRPESDENTSLKEIPLAGINGSEWGEYGGTARLIQSGIRGKSLREEFSFKS